MGEVLEREADTEAGRSTVRDSEASLALLGRSMEISEGILTPETVDFAESVLRERGITVVDTRSIEAVALAYGLANDLFIIDREDVPHDLESHVSRGVAGEVAAAAKALTNYLITISHGPNGERVQLSQYGIDELKNYSRHIVANSDERRLLRNLGRIMGLPPEVQRESFRYFIAGFPPENS